MKKFKLVILWVLFSGLSSMAMGSLPIAKTSVLVVDEEGNSIENAEVVFCYNKPKPSGTGWGTISYGNTKYTDSNGMCSDSNITSNDYGYNVIKDGYYRSIVNAKPNQVNSGKWFPWNEMITIVLRKKNNPVDMYVKKIRNVKIPIVNQLVGFDFEQGDFVAPYGRGVYADISFISFYDYVSGKEAKAGVEILFESSDDKLQKIIFDDYKDSQYKWPYEAEFNHNAKKSIKKHISFKAGHLETNFDKNVNYTFRVRTQLDSSGNVVSASYGKILGDFDIGYKGEISFTYYFNPDGTRNLEFDPDKNLFNYDSKKKKFNNKFHRMAKEYRVRTP